jgi:YHS domain-containing protein
MNAIRKSAWSIVLLGMTAGCGETEPEPAAPVSAPANVTHSAPADKTISPAKPLDAPDSKPGEMKKVDEAPAVEGPKAENSKSSTGTAKLTADDVAAIKELPAAEQAVATQQAGCPVSTHNLGSMGKPVKVTAEGRTFYICCDDCNEKVKTDPKSVIAKLDKK